MEVTNKLVSVLLPVFNGAKTLRRAIDSIFKQTYEKFELIVINDGSTDSTPRILAEYRDPRLKVLHQENRGIVESLNLGIRESQGEYIARMDADDESLPERFTKQVEFLDQNPDVGVVGTAVKMVYPEQQHTVKIRRMPLDTKAIRKNIVRVCPFQHRTVMVRRDVFNKVGVYDNQKDWSKKRLVVADYDLWARVLAAGYEMANLPDVFSIIYKEPNSIMRSRSRGKRLKQQIYSRVEVIKTLNLGYPAYCDIAPVVILSILSHLGLKLDPLFNILAKYK